MNREDRLELFLVYDRDPDDDAANVVDVCGSRDQALAAQWPVSFPVTRALRDAEPGENGLYGYEDVERIR